MRVCACVLSVVQKRGFTAEKKGEREWVTFDQPPRFRRELSTHKTAKPRRFARRTACRLAGGTRVFSNRRPPKPDTPAREAYCVPVFTPVPFPHSLAPAAGKGAPAVGL